MQTDSPPSPLRRLTAACCAILLLGACTSGGDAPPAPQTPTADAVLQSRDALGAPMVRLAEAGIDLANDLQAARYEAERGAPMQRALREVGSSVTALRTAADAGEAAADAAIVDEGATIVGAAAGRARTAAAAAEDEVAFLQRASAVDEALLDVAALWDRPGSQSEIRARLDAAAADAARLRRRARRLQPEPRGCRVMKANRVDWARTVRTRTRRLQSQANSAGGGEFDELRAAFRRLPLGVEPRSADQEERECWRDASAVWQAAEQLRGDVEALEAALQ